MAANPRSGADLKTGPLPGKTAPTAPNVLADPPPSNDLRPEGGIAAHPIHDEDQEDRGPEDYEAEIDRVEEESVQEHPEGSAPPLDRLTQDRTPSDLDPARRR